MRATEAPQDQRRRRRGEPPQASSGKSTAERAAHVGGPLVFVAVGTAYLALAQYALWLNETLNLGPGRGFWPAAGLTTAALLLLPARRWGWVIAAVATAELGAGLAHGYPLAVSLWWVAGNCIGPVVGAALVRRFVHPRGALVPVRRLVGFLALGGAVGPLVGGSVGAVGALLEVSGVWWQVWPQAVAGSSLGVLVVAPVLLTWGEDHPPRRPRETAALLVALALVSVVSPLVSSTGQDAWDITLPFFVLPLVMWAALRYGVRGAALAGLWVTQRAALAAAMGYGPFVADGGQFGHAVTSLQLFLLIAPVSALFLAALVTDLGDQGNVEWRLQRQAHQDALTGLPNRAALGIRLEQMLERGRAQATDVALLVCDLDGFKVINDGLGHHAGDQVLVAIAHRLQTSARPGDVVARLSGDEFVVGGNADARTVSTLTDRILRTVQEPITLDTGQQVTVSVSIGVATAAPHHDANTLLRDADAALYRAKDRGCGRSARFDADLREQALERLSLPQELRAGLTRGELFCLYQPEIEIVSGRLFGFEALVRWQHPDRGLLLPDRFLPSTEASGLVGALFTHVLDESLRTLQRWSTSGGVQPTVSVNLSTRQLHDTNLPELVAATLTRVGVSPDRLWLEVTEGAMADVASFATLAALHDLGVHLAIDDFGTGWSSMARLSEGPWDLLKIDRTFVTKLTPDGRAEHVVRAMIAMAHSLGIRTVAEGVETPEQLSILSSLDCDIAQGYLFARPLDPRCAVTGIGADGTWVATAPGAPYELTPHAQ